MREFLSHLILPRESNNFRAKLLHHTSLFLAVLALLVLTAVFPLIKTNYPAVLGVKTNIKIEELLALTNKEREKAGISDLKLNSTLETIALKKGENMIEKNYWAHNAPDGTTPWTFFKNEGYNYIYAGENLGRGFSQSKDLVNAWMASPDHKANLLSANFQDVGFAVLPGKLDGEDTVLVVQEFGGQSLVASNNNTSRGEETLAKQTQNLAPLIESISISKNISLAIIVLFIALLTLDFIELRNKKIVRVRGHNLDHIMFLLLIVSILFILGKGVTL